MGYRVRLGKIAKLQKKLFKGDTYEAAEKAIGDGGAVYRPPGHTQLYELGSYSPKRKIRLDDFYDFDVYEATENEFYILDKESLKSIILDYQDMVKEYYEGLMVADHQKQWNFLSERARQWGSCAPKPYYLDEDREHMDGDMAQSWEFEYAIFNLVFIYRTFDWKKNYLIYSGW